MEVKVNDLIRALQNIPMPHEEPYCDGFTLQVGVYDDEPKLMSSENIDQEMDAFSVIHLKSKRYRNGVSQWYEWVINI